LQTVFCIISVSVTAVFLSYEGADQQIYWVP
jgi:hypothetical protein